MSQQQRIPGWCPLCRSRCGCISVVSDGRLVEVEPYPEHPTGRALCAKGQAAPELVYSADRLLYPMKRTRPKGDPDPGWVDRSDFNPATRKFHKFRLASNICPRNYGMTGMADGNLDGGF